MRIIATLMLVATVRAAADAIGTWEGKELTVRFEPHTHGEVFTLDTTDKIGRATSSSTILYLDGKARDYQEPGCTGTQSSRRVDNKAVEILRQCGKGEWIRFVRRPGLRPTELILDITEQRIGGPLQERRLVLKKKTGL